MSKKVFIGVVHGGTDSGAIKYIIAYAKYFKDAESSKLSVRCLELPTKRYCRGKFY